MTKAQKGQYRIGWFSTGRDDAARDLLRAVWSSIEEGEIKAEIAFVFSNREPGEATESDSFFELVHSYRIPLICLSSSRFQEIVRERWRGEFEKEAMRRLEGFLPGPDLCVLAGYMLIIGEQMCHRYPMINLHPAAPGGPKGTWQEVIWRLIEQGAEETGVMMHLVTFDRYWDEIKGRSIADVKKQEGERNSIFREIRRYGLAREFPLIIATIKAFSEGRVRIAGERVVDSNEKPIRGYDLSDEIDELIRGTLEEQGS